jgi:hypothetical protein
VAFLFVGVLGLFDGCVALCYCRVEIIVFWGVSVVFLFDGYLIAEIRVLSTFIKRIL